MRFVGNRRQKRLADKRSAGKAEKRRQQGQYVRLTDMSRQRLLGYAESFRELSGKFREEYGRELSAPDPEGDGWQDRTGDRRQGRNDDEWQGWDRQTVLDERRNKENRQVIGKNLEEVAAIMEQVAATELCYKPLEEKKERMLIHALRAEGVFADNLCYLPGSGSRTMGMVLYTEKKGGFAADEVAALLSVLLKCNLEASITSPYIIDHEKRDFVFVEAVRLQALLGISRVVKENETVSGDNFAILHSEVGKKTILLSDGTGSGGQACAESSRVLDLMEKMMGAGFALDAAVGMVNRAMFAKGEDPGHPTLDICDIDLYSGACCIYKIGGAAAFLKQGRFVEIIRRGTLPLGIFENMEPLPIRCRVAEGDYLVFVTDGVLEAMQGDEYAEPAGWMANGAEKSGKRREAAVSGDEDRFSGEKWESLEKDCAEGLQENACEEILARHLQQMVSRNPQDMAEILLQLALKKCGGHVRDDMTVIVVGIWEN